MSTARVVVVGAGIGGLVASLLLAARGLEVTLVDSADEPGGKMRALEVDGVRIDAGPTVFTMRWVFDEILAQAGASLDTLVRLEPLEVLARHAWRRDGSRLDLYADHARSLDAIARFASPGEAQRYGAFCDEARRVCRTLEGPHIRAARPSFVGMVGALGPSGLATLASLGPFASLWRALGRHFHDPRLRQLFARYATYCGASPFAAPATLMLIAHVEAEGVWSVEGGMSGFARRLASLAQQRGVTLRLGCRVQRIRVEQGRARGVVLAGPGQARDHGDDRQGERLDADAVIFNGDIDALATGLLGDPVAAGLRRPPMPMVKRSLSALTWLMHTRTQGFDLARHNVFFDDDYASEFDDVFVRRRLPRKGTVYVCAQDRSCRGAAPHGRERLLALVNAPALDDRSGPLDHAEVESCEQRSWTLLKDCGLRLGTEEPTLQILRRTPTDFARLFPGSAGALYGPATHGWMALFKRSGAATAVPGLYLAGGSVHPGPGVPMAAMSGRQAAATLLAHLDSTSRSRLAPTAGGTSTPSATTAATP